MGEDGQPDVRSAPAVLTVDLEALTANWRQLRDEASTAECAACVKGDAYGLGLERCAAALAEAGCRTFFVATPDEGRRLRTCQNQAHIYVLDGLMPGLAGFYVAHDLRPALSSLEEIAEWATAAAGCKAALHIDTGMNRLGLAPRDVEVLAADPGRLTGVDVSLVMSHLAQADEPDHPGNEAQRAMFERLRTLLQPAPASFANSAGVFLGDPFHFDLVRPGVAIYGGNPFSRHANPVRPVIRLAATVLQVREVEAGGKVGYGGAWTAEGDSRIAIIAAGYCDGLLRSLAERPGKRSANVWLAGALAPVVGRISMDLISVDVSHLAAGEVRRGMAAEIIGEHISVDEVAEAAGTIAYEIFTGLGSRFARVYIG